MQGESIYIGNINDRVFVIFKLLLDKNSMHKYESKLIQFLLLLFLLISQLFSDNH